MAVERTLPSNVTTRCRRQHEEAVKDRQTVEEAERVAGHAFRSAFARLDPLTQHYGQLFLRLLRADLDGRRRMEAAAWRILCEDEGLDPNEEPGDELAELQKAALSNGRP